MDTEHSESIFRNAAVSPPKNPTTSQPLNQYERPYVYSTKEAWVNDTCSHKLAVQGTTTQARVPEGNVRNTDSSSVFDREIRNCDNLLTEVNRLQTGHRNTTAILRRLYNNQKRLNEIATTLLDNCKHAYSISDLSESPLNHDIFHRDDDDVDRQGDSESLDDTSSLAPHPLITSSLLSVDGEHPDTSSESTTESIDEFEQDSYSDLSQNDPFGSHGLEKIGAMWEGFSVDDYVPSSSWNSMRPTEGNNECKPTWRPRITIPKPFAMTLREEQKEKKKTKAQLEAERVEIEKQALEEAELSKKFRANPIPATTYLPLYEMIKVQSERRRQFVKENSIKILKSKEKPFSFVSRELKKLAIKQEELARRMEKEHEEVVGDMFRARPIPRHVLDSDVNEKQKENEEYRRIRIRMRALELLASSHLPNRMRYGNEKYSVRDLHKLQQEEGEKLAFLTGEHRFHPMINGDVPDHRQAYEDFQQKLKERKEEENLLTVTEPFTHRTQNRILERQSKTRMNTAPHQQGPVEFSTGHHQKQQGRIMNDKERKSLQREVSQKSIVNDVSFAMDVKRKEKLKSLK